MSMKEVLGRYEGLTLAFITTPITQRLINDEEEKTLIEGEEVYSTFFLQCLYYYCYSELVMAVEMLS